MNDICLLSPVLGNDCDFLALETGDTISLAALWRIYLWYYQIRYIYTSLYLFLPIRSLSLDMIILSVTVSKQHVGILLDNFIGGSWFTLFLNIFSYIIFLLTNLTQSEVSNSYTKKHLNAVNLKLGSVKIKACRCQTATTTKENLLKSYTLRKHFDINPPRIGDYQVRYLTKNPFR